MMEPGKAQLNTTEPGAAGPEGKRNEWLYVWTAFAGAYAWFNIQFYNGAQNPLSPLGPFIAALGLRAESYLAAVYIPLAVVVIVCFFFMRDEWLYRWRPFWLAVHLSVFGCVGLLPFLRSVPAFYAVCALSSALCGLFIYRIFYSLFFFTPAVGWTKMFVILLGALRAGVHLFSLFPPAKYPWPMYGVSMLVLAATIFFGQKFRGNVLEVRRTMPRTNPSIRPLVPYLLFMAGVQVFIAALKAFVEPVLEQDFPGMLLDLLSSVVWLSTFWFFGDYVKKKETFLRLFFVTMLLAFASHQAFGLAGSNLTIQFMEPAFLCWDIFFYSMLISLFFNYGKQHMKLRVVTLMLFLGLILGQTLLTQLFRAVTADVFSYGGFIYVGAFGLFLLIPYVTKKANLTEIVEDRIAPSIVRGDALLRPWAQPGAPSADTTARRLAAQPQEKLTEREWKILQQLLQNQDADVIAYIYDISENTVRFHIRNICGKFGVNTKAELLRLLESPGLLAARTPAADIALTRRERDVLSLLLLGDENNEIAQKLVLADSTVRYHIHNICRKCGVGSREELVAYIEGKETV